MLNNIDITWLSLVNECLHSEGHLHGFLIHMLQKIYPQPPHLRKSGPSKAAGSGKRPPMVSRLWF